MGRLCQSFEVYIQLQFPSVLPTAGSLTDIKPLFTPQLLEAGANGNLTPGNIF